MVIWKECVVTETKLMRVFLADDEAPVRHALSLLLQIATELGAEVCGESGDAVGLVAQLYRIQPDLLLIDCELPGFRMADHLIGLRATCPNMKIVILSSRPETREAAVRAGADAFVSKADSPDKLIKVLQSIGR